MKKIHAPAVVLAGLFALTGASGAAETKPDETAYKWRVPDGRTHVLWIGGGHWHDTLATAAVMRRVLEGGGRFHLTYTEDTGSLARHKPYDVILLNGMISSMAPEEGQSLLDAVRAGKPLLVLHAASASFRQPPPAKKDDPVAAHPDFYRMLGGYVERHPPLGPVRVRVTAPGHPATAGVPDFEVEDELFLFRNLEPDNEVLLETEFEGTKRPLAWARRWGEGRVLHIALGHGASTAGNPAFQKLLAQGLTWLAAAAAQGQVPASPDKPPRLTAAEVSAKYLPLHPVPRDDGERKIIAVLEDAFARQSRGMGNVPSEDGRLLRMLTEGLGAKHVVELGTANGYSALWFCLALRATGGKLTTHELDAGRIALARENFKRADVGDLVTLVEGDAHETIRKLNGPVDLVLLDAEKEGFIDYLQKMKPLVRKGGLIIAHDSSGQAHLMDAYFKAIAADADLETVFVDASRWGMAITRKMR